MDDLQLLGWFATERSEAAFAELVRRHLDMVYATALRRVGGDRQLAEDVAQNVFADLARKAATLDGRTMLAGWLHRGARFASSQVVRTERRRKTHEQEAWAMNEFNGTAATDWERLRPLIDDAMEQLNEVEREVILLRYFEHRPLADVGAKFSLSPDAARMRLDRALDKLQSLLAKRGIVSTAAALVTTFASQAGATAPAGLAAAVMAGVFGGAAAVGVVGAGATKAAPLALGKGLVVGIGGAVAAGVALLVTLQVTHERTAAETGSVAPPAVMTASPAETPLTGAVESGRGETPARGGVPPAREAPPKAPRKGNANVDSFTERLDRLVGGLSAEQKAAARTVFAAQEAALRAFSSAEERLEKGTGVRQQARTEIRALLTPTQQRIYDAAPQRLGGASPLDPAGFMAHLDGVVGLTQGQMLHAAALYQKQVEALQALSAEERVGVKGRELGQRLNGQLRELLTPEQQRKLAASPGGTEDVVEQAEVVAWIKSSPAITARLGAVKVVVAVDQSVATSLIYEQVLKKEGACTYEVRGASGTETLTVTWERATATATAAVRVVKVENGKGEVIAGAPER